MSQPATGEQLLYLTLLVIAGFARVLFVLNKIKKQVEKNGGK